MNEWLNRALAAASEAVAVPVAQDTVCADRVVSADSPPNCANYPICTGVQGAKTDKGGFGTSSTATPARSQTGQDWDAETAALIKWFLGTTPPTHPFQLQRAVTIAHPDNYWEYLRQDIAAGPNRARGKSGAFQENLRQLYRLFHDSRDIGGGTA